MTATALRLERFDLGYPTPGGTRLILEQVTVEVRVGDFVLLLGPSGGGKSSLLAALLGLDDPYAPRLRTSGRLDVLGVRVQGPLPKSLRARIGTVFQDGALIDELSPRANVALAVRERDGSRARVEELLEVAGLPRPPREVAALSGGQRRRIALARALAGEPGLLVLDEPTAGIDAKGGRAIARLLRAVHDADEERTTIVVTHDIDAFREVADSALLLDPRRGTLELIDIEQLDEALERSEQREAIPVGPPAVAPGPPLKRAAGVVGRGLLALASLPVLALQALRFIVPYHLGMVGRALRDLVLAPAAFLTVASATAGGLATNFAIDTNPLEGAFRREVLLGTGKVLVSSAMPLLVGVLFAAHTAAAATARLGGLRKSRVFEALPFLGVRPEAFLLTPLLLGSIVAAVGHTAIGIVSGSLASLLTARIKLGISPFSWASASFAVVAGSDLRWAALKAILSGGATALICYRAASTPKRSEAEIASATSSALVGSTLAVLVIHGVLAVVQFS